MGLTRIIILTIAISMAIAIATISVTRFNHVQDIKEENFSSMPMPSKRMSRFLAQNDKIVPRAADHCHKDNEVCFMTKGLNSTCCNNKCMDLSEDNHNCGACKKKCKFTEVCCRGQCVNTNFDKRHCGVCNHRCQPGQYCVYGMCNYA